MIAVDEVERGRGDLVVDGLHPLGGERTRVLAALLPPLAEARVVGERTVSGRRRALEDAARPELRLERGILRVVLVLRLLLGVEVVEVTEELVEPVHRGQVLVAVAEVVLAELAGRVALPPQQGRQRRVLVREPLRRTRQSHLGEARADRRLPGDESRPARRAALLGVGVGEDGALAGEPVDVGRPITHHPAVVGADVPVADVIAEHDEDVGSLLGMADVGDARQQTEADDGGDQDHPAG